jgi:hypothetical protein
MRMIAAVVLAAFVGACTASLPQSAAPDPVLARDSAPMSERSFG